MIPNLIRNKVIKRSRGCLLAGLLLLVTVASRYATASEPVVQRLEGPDESESVDHRFKETLDGPGLRFRYEQFDVRAGSVVRLELQNQSDMTHNFILLKGDPGTDDMAIAKQALKMENGFKNQFVPEDKRILVASSLLQPSDALTLTFRAPEQPGQYPFVCSFPGHAETMRGVMQVRGSDSSLNKPVPSSVDHKNVQAPEDREYMKLRVQDQTRVIRTQLPDLSTRSIAVGLPGNLSYGFDAETAVVAYAWTGGFLDVSHTRTGRGRYNTGDRRKALRKKAQPMGERVKIHPGDQQPLRIGDPDNIPVVQFQGYANARGKLPVLTYKLNDLVVNHAVRPVSTNPVTLAFEYELGHVPKGDLFFVPGSNTVDVSSQEGTWTDGQLRIPSNEAKAFTIKVTHQKAD